jgi:creatinine amidohydrolase
MKGGNLMKLHMSDMSWPEVQELLKTPHVAVVPVGSTEQHGLHLPLNVDATIATYLAEKAAEKVNAEGKFNVVVAPTVQFGMTGFVEFPGTITISFDTEVGLLFDIANSFLRQGFKNILFFNCHGGNIVPLKVALQKASGAHPGCGLFAVDWPDLGFDTIPKIRQSSRGRHADEIETSLSLLIQPQNVHMEKATKALPEAFLSEKWIIPDYYGPNHLLFSSRGKSPRMGKASGVMGDATLATRETGEKVAAAIITDLAELIIDIVQSEARSQKE